MESGDGLSEVAGARGAQEAKEESCNEEVGRQEEDGRPEETDRQEEGGREKSAEEAGRREEGRHTQADDCPESYAEVPAQNDA